MTVSRLLIAVLMWATAATSWADDKEGVNDLEALKGEWLAVRVQGPDGELPPKAELQRDQITWTFQAEGKAMFSLKGPPGFEVKYTYRIDPSKNPKQIDLAKLGGKGEQFGIYKVDNGKLTLCLTDTPGLTKEERPKAFDAKAGKVMLFEMERPAKK